MSARDPDFTDAFNARLQRNINALQGLEAVAAGELKKARQFEREAERWDRELKRLTAHISQRARSIS